MKKLPDPTGENTLTDAYEKAKGKLDEYFAPKMNRVYLMNSLNQVRQNRWNNRRLPYVDARETGSTQPEQNDNHGTNRSWSPYCNWSTIAQTTTSEKWSGPGKFPKKCQSIRKGRAASKRDHTVRRRQQNKAKQRQKPSEKYTKTGPQRYPFTVRTWTPSEVKIATPKQEVHPVLQIWGIIPT